MFDKTNVHMDKLKTVLKSHNMDLGLLLIEVVTLPHGSIGDQTTYIKRLNRFGPTLLPTSCLVDISISIPYLVSRSYV